MILVSAPVFSATKLKKDFSKSAPHWDCRCLIICLFLKTKCFFCFFVIAFVQGLWWDCQKEVCSTHVTCTSVTRIAPPLFFASWQTPVDLSHCLPWGLESLSVPLFSPSFPFFHILPKMYSCSVLNEGRAALGCAVTNWHRGGRWWRGGD